MHYMISPNLHNSIKKDLQLLAQFLEEEMKAKKVKYLPQIAQLIRKSAKVYTEPVWCQCLQT